MLKKNNKPKKILLLLWICMSWKKSKNKSKNNKKNSKNIQP